MPDLNTFTLAQLDALCHAIEDYLALTLDEHVRLHNNLTTEFTGVRRRLVDNFAPIEAKIWMIKNQMQLPVTKE